jgi:hypothetical protein
MKLQSRRWAAAAVILSGSVLFAATSAGQTRPLEQERSQTPNRQRFGAVTISWGHAQIVAKRSAGVSVEFVNGWNGAKNVEFTSKQYDMAAPRIVVNLRNGKVQTGTATGGVSVEVRQDSIVDKKPMRRVTRLQGDNAVYTGAVPAETKGTPGKPAQIVIRGNVRGVMRSPEFSLTDPFKIDASIVTVTFVDAETTVIDMDNAKGSGTPLEREPKEKP